MATPTYRFFPWARRGLAAALPPPAGELPSRPLARVKITVTPEIVEQRDIRLLGPGDVLGIDTRLIVRTEPRLGTADFEPNYLAAIEFDPPELPWLFTPTGAGPDDKLPPWLVLIVLDRAHTELPKVVRGRPLPSLKAVVGELPDLADSWAWAHVQRLAAGDDGADAQELVEAPDLNVSRLLCPRRLAPHKEWLACLVPAFDAGVQAGLGVPRGAATLNPAWTAAQSEVELPVYYHWEFGTGSAGDFEYLARRLKPVISSAANVTAEATRRAKVYLGGVDDHEDTLAALPPDAPAAYARLDAPLAMMDAPDPSAADTSPAFAAAVGRAVTPGRHDELLPPIYGDRHAKRFALDPSEIERRWLEELNLDARTRVAARLGGDAIRRFQEQLMQAAWMQVGDVLAANTQLGRSRFAAFVAERALVRHVDALPPSRVLALTVPLHARLLAQQRTVRARVASTSLADTAFEPSLRRLASPVGRLARAVTKSAAPAERATVRYALTRGIATALQKDSAAVDPSIADRDGIGGFALGERVASEVGITPGQPWTSGPAPLDTTFDPAALSRRVEAEVSVAPRADLATAGVLAPSHLEAISAAARVSGAAPDTLLAQFRTAAAAAPNAVRLALQRPAAGETPKIVAIEQAPDGSLVLFDTVANSRATLLAAEGLSTRDTRALDDVLVRTPRGVLAEGAHRAIVRNVGDRREVTIEMGPRALPTDERLLRDGARGVDGALRTDGIDRTVRRGAGEGAAGPLRREGEGAGSLRREAEGVGVAIERERVTIPPDAVVPPEERLFQTLIPAPLRDARSVNAVIAAFGRLAESHAIAMPERALVRADLSGAGTGLAAQVRAAIDPRTVFRRRAESMVKAPSWLRPPGADVLDPIMASPVLKVSVGGLLASVAPERFLPAELELPDESITALSTNPRFVAAAMVGANHEMNRELLWRTYPTDARGTPLKRFWDWFDEARVDVDALHAWPAEGPLVARLTGGTPSVVLVVKGRLLRRYPNTTVLAWKAAGRGKLASVPDGDAAARRAVLREPVFRMLLDPDICIVGLDLSETEITQSPEPGWYIVLQEPITEPRFGLDEPDTPQSGRRSRNDLNWSATGAAAGAHVLAGAVMAGLRHSADVADALLQRPVRVALHGTQITPAFRAPS